MSYGNNKALPFVEALFNWSFHYLQPKSAFYLYRSASRGRCEDRCSQLWEVALASSLEALRLDRKHLTCAPTGLRTPPPGGRGASPVARLLAPGIGRKLPLLRLGQSRSPLFASRDWSSLGTCAAVLRPVLIGSCGARDHRVPRALGPSAAEAAVVSPSSRQSCDGDRCRSAAPEGSLSRR